MLYALQERCFIRRGHGFFILAADCAGAEQTFDEVVLPYLQQHAAAAAAAAAEAEEGE